MHTSLSFLEEGGDKNAPDRSITEEETMLLPTSEKKTLLYMDVCAAFSVSLLVFSKEELADTLLGM